MVMLVNHTRTRVAGRRGIRILVPPGNTITGLVRHGMTMKERSSDRAARAVGLDPRAYRFVKKLLTLKDRGVLNQDELRTVDGALEQINRERQVGGRMENSINQAVDRHWRPHTMNGSSEPQRKLEQKSRKRLDRTLFLIRETCTNNEEMLMPPLTAADKVEAIAMLTESIAGLSLLITKIQSGGKDDV